MASHITIAETGTITTTTGDVNLGVQREGGIQLAANITTAGGDVILNSAMVLTDDVAITTGAGGGAIRFGDTLDGGYDLSLSAGEGSVTFEQAVGGITSIDALTVNSASGGYRCGRLQQQRQQL